MELSREEEKILLNKLTKKYKNNKIGLYSGKNDPVHGKAIGILWNTHCDIKIVKFEQGNEFVTEKFLQKMLKDEN